ISNLLHLSVLGFTKQRITSVVVNENQTTKLNVALEANSSTLDEVCITAYKVPLIDFDQSSSVKTVTAESIARSPMTNVAGLAATSAGLSRDANGNISYFRYYRDNVVYDYSVRRQLS
ncbi:hypothetical protein N9B82_05710, partial [Saprospiraceae bacterium]|nr:hypothetical protein [Saprospiraceae bacterium]